MSKPLPPAEEVRRWLKVCGITTKPPLQEPAKRDVLRKKSSAHNRYLLPNYCPKCGMLWSQCQCWDPVNQPP